MLKLYHFPPWLLFLVAILAAPASAADLSGVADVIDGDTLALRGERTRVRLYGIDTPEGQQTCDDATGKRYLCGSRAADALASLVGRNGRVACDVIERDRYGRSVAVCQANSRELNGELVRQGWALEYQQYSDGRYADEQREAQSAKRGLWAGAFIEPRRWRRGERLPSEGAAEPRRACAIKGNVSGSGRIYHVPSGRYYHQTRIDESQGEHWFCTEQEATAAGWRASRE